MLVIMPLLTSGALVKLLGQFGVRLPASLQQFAGGRGGGMGGGDRFFARGGARDYDGGTSLPGLSGGMGSALGAAMGIAKQFM